MREKKFGQKIDAQLFMMDQEKEEQRRNWRREKIWWGRWKSEEVIK